MNFIASEASISWVGNRAAPITEYSSTKQLYPRAQNSSAYGSPSRKAHILYPPPGQISTAGRDALLISPEMYAVSVTAGFVSERLNFSIIINSLLYTSAVTNPPKSTGGLSER